jgi:hypothetical protein
MLRARSVSSLSYHDCMKIRPLRILLMLPLTAGLLAAASLSPGQQPPDHSLSSLAFLSGRWLSEKGSEFQEEDWMPAQGNSMVGTFRVLQDGKPVFYEFWAIELDDNHPVMKLKHFNAGLKGWEQKDASTRMPLISSGPDDAIFAETDGSVSLHYHRKGQTLTCLVHHLQDGHSKDETFTMRRVSGN